MDIAREFDDYMAYLMQGLGHADRHAGLSDYCTGLMLPLSRKSVEPMAARVDPLHARKMAARVQAATASGKPVLLHYDTEGGHSGGLPIVKQIANTADMLAFLVSQVFPN